MSWSIKNQELCIVFIHEKNPASFPCADGTTKMIKILQNYIQKKGREAIDEITTNAIEDPSTFIKTVTNMYKKLTDLVRVAFKDAQQFRNCLDKAFESFLNQNKLTKTYGSEKCVELLTKYCDNIGLAFGEFLGELKSETHTTSV